MTDFDRQRLVAKIIKRFRGMNADNIAYFIIMAFNEPHILKRMYPEVFN